jgi:5-methylcytosine-specific restriction endonuclease McrA
MVSVETRLAILFTHGFCCFYCGKPANAVDHIDPNGGSHPHNLTAACGPCNTARGDRPLPDVVRREALALAFSRASMVERMAREFKEATKRARRLIVNGSLPLRA